MVKMLLLPFFFLSPSLSLDVEYLFLVDSSFFLSMVDKQLVVILVFL